jgi:hypothetical protein
MALVLNTIPDKSGNIPYPPKPAFRLVEDGKIVQEYTLDEIENFALAEITRIRKLPKTTFTKPPETTE